MDKDQSPFQLPPTAIRTLSKNYNGGRITADILRRVEEKIGKPLPPDFCRWLIKFGDRCLMRYGGNFMTYALHPGADPLSLLNAIEDLKEDNWPIDDRFIVFGSDGRDGLFCFYTQFQDAGEYPVVMVDGNTPNPDKPYVFVGRSFAGFVNTYVHFEHWRSTAEPEDLENDQLVMDFLRNLCKKNRPGLSAAVLMDLYDPANYLDREMLNKRLKEEFGEDAAGNS